MPPSASANEHRAHEDRASQTVLPVSGILIHVRRIFFFAILLLIAGAIMLAAPAWTGQAQEPAPTPSPAPPNAQAPAPPPQPPAQETPKQPAAPATPSRTLNVVVLDPGHGGTDAGARGGNGVIESEVVLSYARALRAELERQGLRVVVTRQGNENPTPDERSALANRQRGSVFLSLHISSTGPPGTARAYTLPEGVSPPARSGPLPWDQAQEPYAERSRRLAELLQVQLAQKFRGSPEVPARAAVRQLRTIATPAVAVEVSSVSALKREQLEQMGTRLAEAVARAVTAYRPLYEAGAN